MNIEERPQGILITFPVQFLIDLGNTHYLNNVLKKSYNSTRESWKDYHKRIFSLIGTKGFYLTDKKSTISYGYLDCLRQINACKNESNIIWYHGMAKLPQFHDELLFCYINILSKIRFKARVIGFDPGGKIKFDDGRKREFNHWLLLNDFEPIPQIRMGGFQGFRYWKGELI